MFAKKTNQEIPNVFKLNVIGEMLIVKNGVAFVCLLSSRNKHRIFSMTRKMHSARQSEGHWTTLARRVLSGTQIQGGRPSIVYLSSYNTSTRGCSHYIGANVRHIPDEQGKQIPGVCTSNGKELPPYEPKHVLFVDKRTGYALGILTSCQDKDSGFLKVDDTNFMCQKVSKLPDAPSKQQWCRPFDSPRVYPENTLETNKKATKFLNDPRIESRMDEVINQSHKTVQPPIVRVERGSNELYHENGQPIYDENGHEIEY
jgi:hypothetical protein